MVCDGLTEVVDYETAMQEPGQIHIDYADPHIRMYTTAVGPGCVKSNVSMLMNIVVLAAQAVYVRIERFKVEMEEHDDDDDDDDDLK